MCLEQVEGMVPGKAVKNLCLALLSTGHIDIVCSLQDRWNWR